MEMFCVCIFQDLQQIAILPHSSPSAKMCCLELYTFLVWFSGYPGNKVYSYKEFGVWTALNANKGLRVLVFRVWVSTLDQGVVGTEVSQLSYRQAKRPRVQAELPYHTIPPPLHLSVPVPYKVWKLGADDCTCTKQCWNCHQSEYVS